MKKDEIRDMDDNTPEEEMTVELELDDGRVVNCAVITILEVEKKDYIALLPLDEKGENTDGEVWFYRYKEDENDPNVEPELTYIEDDDEYDAVADAFVTAANAVNQFFQAIRGGGTFTKAKKQAVEFGDALGGAAGKAKELKKQTFGFDELNIFSEPSGGGGKGFPHSPFLRMISRCRPYRRGYPDISGNTSQ